MSNVNVLFVYYICITLISQTYCLSKTYIILVQISHVVLKYHSIVSRTDHSENIIHNNDITTAENHRRCGLLKFFPNSVKIFKRT